ncbi:carboxypeptidase-like regulatory domain-containing protein [Mucilaginibacter boryungensis]|uniref:Carboxypeptidase-like regulatory domain-containing protein n=1 Tax=Mucilaginibacter boryungensis TaxID=768480 RepID=A0ABR9XH15_9SPHI|nr:carboxypeptidase-like regulatory domain-containing protein [Mucilaginibacter boryungensis]MBE9666289.1 carboxypeptidase-like regulatory domain-containing protein [Mucilaginibacter boryungensis]
MKNIKSISITNPCHEKWSGMTPLTNGRHCATCCKTVVDFTTMSNQQIIDVLSGANNVCGRFMPAQMALLNQSLQTQKTVQAFWKKWAVAAAILLCSVPIYKAAAKERPVITLQPIKADDKIQKSRIDTTAQITISGKVVTKDDGAPLPGALIRVPNTNIKTATSVGGDFQLVIPAKVKEFEVGFIGFEIMKIKVKSNPDHNYKIALKTSTAVMGEVVIERQ